MPVLVLSVEELNEINKKNPFLINNKIDISQLHVTILNSVPEQPNIERLNEIISGNDEFKISGRIIYLFCPNGYGRTKFNNTFFENKLKVSATTRNWKTITALSEICALG